MGEIRKYTCKCGYEADLHAGGGLAGCNISMIANFFPKETEALLKEQKQGRIKRYFMENELSYCRNCKELMALPAFSYTRKDGYTCHFASSCPVCAGQLEQAEDEESPACPKCGAKMQYFVLGDWD